MKQEPLVSICCITYNHSTYIKDAIEGFLMQKTTFPLEIIIHDDASTDGTAEIIKAYAEKHRDLIFPVFQTENQFSKKQGSISARFVWPHTRGKYIALCEGDDYWTDPLKLQKQIDAMKENPACHICFHPAKVFDMRINANNRISADYGDSQKIFTSGQVIEGGGGFMPTTSLVIHRHVIDNLPDWFFKVPVGDYYIQILGSLHGGALYLNENMAVYRYYPTGSWTTKLKDSGFKLNFYLRQLEAYDHADAYTKIFQKEFKTVKTKLLNEIIRDRVIDAKTKEDMYHQNVKIIPFTDKLAWYLYYRNKALVNFVFQTKRLIKHLFFPKNDA